MIKKLIFEEEGHAWYVLCRDPEKSEHVIDTNEYVVVTGGEGLMLDPGGMEIFAQVASVIAEVIPFASIKHIFGSHQDPDVISSLPLWTGLSPSAKVYIPWMWKGFIAHFGLESVNQFVPIPDEGMDITFDNRARVTIVPAHYCHSAGNFSIYDARAKILFSGDIGTGLLPKNYTNVFVEDFDRHIQYMEAFHKRWMPSNSAKNDWIERVRALDVNLLCPQHGAIFKGHQVKQFLDWFEALEVGIWGR